MRKSKPGRPAKPKARFYLAAVYGQGEIDETYGPFSSPDEAVRHARAEQESAQDSSRKYIVLAASLEQFSFKEPGDVALLIDKEPFA